MAKFFLRTQKEAGEGTLYITIQRKTPKVSLRYIATGITVDVQTWNKANKSIQAWNKFAATEEGVNLTRKMSLVTQSIERLFEEGAIGGNEDKDIIEKALHDISTEDAIKFKEEQRKRRKEEQERRSRSVIGFYEYFFKGISDGSIRHGSGKQYSNGSVEVWKHFGTYLYEFCDADMLFDDVNKPFADKFSVYLEEHGMMGSTINKYVGCFRKLCNLAAEEGVNNNAVSLKVWKERSLSAREKRTEIYLNDEELNALYAMPLEPDLSEVRDVFFVGYLSGQRFSDYSDFSLDNFKRIEGGIDVIVVVQKKTGNYVEIPIWDNRLMELVKRYNYCFPKVDKRELNRKIKTILEMLSESVPSLCERYVTMLQLTERRSEALYQSFCERLASGVRLTPVERNEYLKMKRYAEKHNGSPLYERDGRGRVVKAKWELVSSHTARRSMITNLYKSGLLDTREMMSISGHQSERVFENYIKVGKREQAQRVGEKLRKAKVMPLKKAE